MAYEKTNWTSATPVNAANLNRIEEGIKQNSDDIETKISELTNILSKKGTYIKVTNSTEQTLATKTTYTLQFDTVCENTSDCLSLSENKIIIGKGVSNVLVSGRWSTSGGHAFQKYIYLFKNDGQKAYKMESSSQTLETSVVVDVVEGDCIFVKCYHEKGSDTVITKSETQTHLQVTVL